MMNFTTSAYPAEPSTDIPALLIWLLLMSGQTPSLTTLANFVLVTILATGAVLGAIRRSFISMKGYLNGAVVTLIFLLWNGRELRRLQSLANTAPKKVSLELL